MHHSDISVCQEELVRIRRQLHMYPELKWDLPLTTALVREELDRAGIAYEFEKYGKNTIVATINPEKSHFTIGIRADMDALPIQENHPDLPYCSKHNGVMHACGHDAHTTMLIGAAKALNEIRDQITCRIRLLFQPCEEGRPSGARTMCEHGVMKDIDCIIMCHVNCVDPVHVISSNPATTNCASVAWKIELGGKGAHVAAPHWGVDALAAGVKIYNGIQFMLTREVDPFDTCVLSVTCMHAGETVSSNAAKCVMEGSLRCLHDKTLVWAQKRLEKLAQSVAEECGVTWSLSWSGDPLPSAHNDPALYEAFVQSARKAVGEDRVVNLDISPGAEDFAYYEKIRPGLLFGLGLRNEAKGACHPAHTRNWDIDEDGMETGVRVFVQFVLDHMNGIKGVKKIGGEA